MDNVNTALVGGVVVTFLVRTADSVLHSVLVPYKEHKRLTADNVTFWDGSYECNLLNVSCKHPLSTLSQF